VNKFIGSFIIIFSLVVVFLATFKNPIEFDLGWQLRDGQYIVQNKAISRENIYSYEMPTFRWVSDSWGTNVIRYLVYDNFGFLGLTILGSILTTLTFFIFFRIFGFRYWEIAIFSILFLYLEEAILSVGFKGQTVSYLLIAILYTLLRKFQDGRHGIIFLTVPLFLLWTNLHGEFFLGLAVFGLWVAGYVVKFTKLSGHLFLILAFVLSGLITLANPYGVELYTKSVLLHTGTEFKQIITEWYAPEVYSTEWWKLVGWGGVLAGGVILSFFQKRFLRYLPYLLPVVVLYVLSFVTQRFAWPMYLVSIPLVYPMLKLVKLRSSWAVIISFVILIPYYLYVSFRVLPYAEIFSMDWKQFCETNGCSITANDFFYRYIKDNNVQPGKYFTYFNWGGWLIWNYPDIKPTIDGRMSLWRDEKGYSAFEKYFKYEIGKNNIDETEYNLVLTQPIGPMAQSLRRLVAQNKWELLYEDDLAGVWRREMNDK